MAESSPVLQVALVSADRTVWSGDAAMVIARTTAGDLGVLPGHEPMLSLLADSVVEIQVAGIDINAVGYILMLGGLIGIVLGLVWWQQGRTRVVHRETPVVEERIREY
jgi:F0F1-type ATP synthase epsilon subunit